MRYYERLAEDDRMMRRTIADALEVLREFAGFKATNHAEIRIGLLKLPSSNVVGLVDLEFAAPLEEKTYSISLPTSAQFHAARTDTSRRGRFDIARLDGAVVNSTGTVLLSDGVKLRAVEVIPARMPLEPSELDWRIVRQAISLMKAEKSCYRSLKSGLPVQFQKMAPDLLFIDCSALPDLQLPMFKIIAGLIQAEYPPEETPPSQQQIADSLRKFGIRVPKPRPRKKVRRVSALMSLG